jgi:hypothetical protein
MIHTHSSAFYKFCFSHTFYHIKKSGIARLAQSMADKHPAEKSGFDFFHGFFLGDLLNIDEKNFIPPYQLTKETRRAHMKIYLLDKGVVLVGKAWEVREKLKEYSRKYKTVEQWTKDK